MLRTIDGSATFSTVVSRLMSSRVTHSTPRTTDLRIPLIDTELPDGSVMAPCLGWFGCPRRGRLLLDARPQEDEAADEDEPEVIERADRELDDRRTCAVALANRVASSRPRRPARAAVRTRPPSMGSARRRLKPSSDTFSQVSRASHDSAKSLGRPQARMEHESTSAGEEAEAGQWCDDGDGELIVRRVRHLAHQ